MNKIHNNIWKLYLFGFFHGMHFLGAILIPFFTDWGGLNFSQIMFLQTIFLLNAFIFEIPTGVVADKYGRKSSLLLAIVATMIGLAIYITYPSFLIFAIGEIFWGLGLALFSGAGEAFLYDTLKQLNIENQSKQKFANTEKAFLFGLMIAGPLGSLIYFVFQDLRMPFLFMLIPQAIALIIGFTFIEPIKNKKHVSKKYIAILKNGVSFFWQHKILKILALDMVVIASVAYFIIFFYQGLLIQLNLDIKYFGFILFFIMAAEIIVISSYQKMEKMLKAKKRLIILSALITGVSFILLGLINYLPLVIIIIILVNGFGLTREPLFSSYMNKYIPSHQRATTMSAINMCKTFCLVIINPIAGLMADWSIQYTLLILGIIAIIFTIISRSRIQEEMLID